jgi:hypothetical protein
MAEWFNAHAWKAEKAVAPPTGPMKNHQYLRAFRPLPDIQFNTPKWTQKGPKTGNQYQIAVSDLPCSIWFEIAPLDIPAYTGS